MGVTHYSHAYGFSPAKWDLHITNIRISDAALYQCHVTFKDNKKSIRSNVKLHIEGRTYSESLKCILNVYATRKKTTTDTHIDI